MNQLTDIGKLAYMKTEEVEEKLVSLKSKINELEKSLIKLSRVSDPNNILDEPFLPPALGSIITTNAVTCSLHYFSTKYAYTYPATYFTSEATSSLTIKANINVYIENSPCNLTVDLYLNDNLVDTYILVNPEVGKHTISFNTSCVSTTTGHKLHYKAIPSYMGSMTYEVVDTSLEILGDNVDFLNTQKSFSVYYNDDYYYLSKCIDGKGYYLKSSSDIVSLDAEFALSSQVAVEQKFFNSCEYINGIWKTVNLGWIYKTGDGKTYLGDYNNQNNQFSCGITHGIDFIPNYNASYGGIIVLSNHLGNLYYYDIYKDLSGRATRTIDVISDFYTQAYVNVCGVKIIDSSYNQTIKKAKLIATRIDGTNIFYDAADSNANTLEIGYGSNVKAFYANESGSIINVYMRVYNKLVKKVLKLNNTSNKYELIEQFTIGTWDEYIEGKSPSYFTVIGKSPSFNYNN